MLQSLKRELI